jgi:transposase
MLAMTEYFCKPIWFEYNMKEVFSIGLGLSEPWFIENVQIINTDRSLVKELHIHINFEKGYKFTIDNHTGTAYNTEDRVWQHLDFFQHKCFIHARVPRIKLPDGKVRQVSVPWARVGSGFTLLFEGFAMLLIENEMPVAKVAKTVKVTDHRIWRLFDYWVEKAKSKNDLSDVNNIGIDETSSKKGHKYITVFADMEERRVIDVKE